MIETDSYLYTVQVSQVSPTRPERAEAPRRVCHKSVTHPFFVFFLFTDTKSLKNIFIYNKAQTFTSSGFAFPQKICIFAENFLKYGKDTNKI